MLSLDTADTPKTQEPSFSARITVLGIGGGGNNMVNSMVAAGYENISFVAINTDMQALAASRAQKKVQIGVKSTRGLGAGAYPEMGARAAEEDIDAILEETAGADIVFLLAGLGGGTGSGALSVIARALKEKDVLVVSVVTKPFIFEGKKRERIAQEVIEKLKHEVDTLIVLPNQKLVDIADENITLLEAFERINNLIDHFIRAIADIINRPGHINVDFADIRTIMKHQGHALIGTARASGQDRAAKAAREALSSPLLEAMDIKEAQGIMMNITGSTSLGLNELQTAASLIYEYVSDSSHIVLGSVLDDALGDDVIVTIIATGFQEIAQPCASPGHKIPTTQRSYEPQDRIHTQILQSPAQPPGAPSQREGSPQRALQTGTYDMPTQPDELDIPAFIRKKAQRQHNI